MRLMTSVLPLGRAHYTQVFAKKKGTWKRLDRRTGRTHLRVLRTSKVYPVEFSRTTTC